MASISIDTSESTYAHIIHASEYLHAINLYTHAT